MADRHRSLQSQISISLADLETLFGLAIVTVSDEDVAGLYGLDVLPGILLFQSGKSTVYEGKFFGNWHKK